MLWLYNLPLWVLCALIQGVCIAYALVAVLLVRRLGWQIREKDNGVAAALHAFVGVLYAISSWALTVFTGPDKIVAAATEQQADLIFNINANFLGAWIVAS